MGSRWLGIFPCDLRVLMAGFRLGVTMRSTTVSIAVSGPAAGGNRLAHRVFVGGKGRVGEWLQMQPTSTGEDDFTWSQVSTTPYMEMLTIVRVILLMNGRYTEIQ